MNGKPFQSQSRSNPQQPQPQGNKDKYDFPSLWKDEEKTRLNSDVFWKDAEKLANMFHPSPKSSQLRKFYDEIVHYSSMVRAKPDDSSEWANVEPLVKMIIAKAAYAEARKNVSKYFSDFIQHYIKKIDSPKDLTAFCSFFEAIVGFHKLCEEQNKNHSRSN